MEKTIKKIFVVMLCMFLAACGKTQSDGNVESGKKEEEFQEEMTGTAQEQSTMQETEFAISSNSVKKISERPSQTVENYVVLEHINNGLILYVPNEDNTKLVCVPWDQGSLSDRFIVEELIARGILPEGSAIDGTLNATPKAIYVHRGFEEYLLTLTPEQEDMVMASLIFSIGANGGHREVAVYSHRTDELLVTNNYAYDIPVSPDYYYELFEETVSQEIEEIDNLENVELGDGPEGEEKIIAMSRISEVTTEGSSPNAWETMNFSAAEISGIVGVSQLWDMEWGSGQWVSVHYSDWSNSYQQLVGDIFSSISFYYGTGSEDVVAAIQYGGDAGLVPIYLPGDITQNSTAIDVRNIYGTPDYVSPDSYYYFSDDYTKALHIRFASILDEAKISEIELVDTLKIFAYGGNAEDKKTAVADYLKESLAYTYSTETCKYIDEDVRLGDFFTEFDEYYNLCRVKIR